MARPTLLSVLVALLLLLSSSSSAPFQIGVADVTVRLPTSVKAGEPVYSPAFKFNQTLWRLQLFPKGAPGYAARHGYWSCYLERVGGEDAAGDAAGVAKCRVYSAEAAGFRSRASSDALARGLDPNPATRVPRTAGAGDEISFDIALRRPGKGSSGGGGGGETDPHYFCSAHSFGGPTGAAAKGALIFGRQSALDGQSEVFLRARLGPPGLRLDTYDAIVGAPPPLAGVNPAQGLPALLQAAGEAAMRPVQALQRAIAKARRGLGPRPRGLRNLCNTCYMNSVLQGLYAVPTFREALLEPGSAAAASLGADTGADADEDVGIEGGGANVATPKFSNAFRALRDTFFDMSGRAPTPLPGEQFARRSGGGGGGKGRSVDPTPLARRLGIDARVQQDAQEFVRLLVEAMGRGSAVDLGQLFAGQMRTTIRAPEAGFEKHRLEAFKDVSLDVRGMSSLGKALEAYTSVDVLDGDNKYRVTDKGYFRAERFSRFLTLPPVLQIHLKRFAFDPKTFGMAKVTDRLAFPKRLDMAPYLADGAEAPEGTDYELQSVVIHVGGVDSGHYYAFVRAPAAAADVDEEEEEEDRWFRVDDEDVRPVTLEDVQREAFGGGGGGGAGGRFKWTTPTAYLLQYTRLDRGGDADESN